MCSHYTALKKAKLIEKHFRAGGVPAPAPDMWPKYQGVFVRRPPEWESGDEAVPEREAVTGRWGMISAQTKDTPTSNATFNARTETAHQLFSYRMAWRRAQHCIIPAEAIFEPDHRHETKERFRTHKPIPTRFTRADGAPLGIAGLWDTWRSPAGEWIESFTMLTINADNHPLFRNYHKPEEEKRMVAILPDDAYEGWLTATVEQTLDFLRPYPADKLVAEPQPAPDDVPQGTLF